MSSVYVETTSSQVERRWPILGIRWGAIFAGLAVGLSLHLLLMLLGIAAGLTVLKATDTGTEVDNATLIAGIWNTLAMLISAFVGGFVAARASGLRRSSDGMLHGAVSWGATTLLIAMLTTTALGAAVSGAFSVLRPVVAGVSEAVVDRAASDELSSGVFTFAELDRELAAGRRDQAIALLQERYGLPAERASAIVDRLSAARSNVANQPSSERSEQAITLASAAGWWLVATITLSLLLGIVGGAVGTRSRQRRKAAADRKEGEDVRRGVPVAAMREPSAQSEPPRHRP